MSSRGVGCYILILFAMLVAVFLLILFFDWKMTKGMGYLMLAMYVVFIFVSLGFSYNWYKCIIE